MDLAIIFKGIQTLLSTDWIFAAVLSGLSIQYFLRIYKKQEKAISIANYTKILFYNSYHINADIIALTELLPEISIQFQANPSVIPSASTIEKKWDSILSSLREKNPDNFLQYYQAQSAIHDILNHKDSELWNNYQDKFISLPPKEFELLYKYFSQTRYITEVLLNPYWNFKHESSIKLFNDYSQYTNLISTYLLSLISEGERKVYQYLPLLSYTFKNRKKKEFEISYNQYIQNEKALLTKTHN